MSKLTTELSRIRGGNSHQRRLVRRHRPALASVNDSEAMDKLAEVVLEPHRNQDDRSTIDQYAEGQLAEMRVEAEVAENFFRQKYRETKAFERGGDLPDPDSNWRPVIKAKVEFPLAGKQVSGTAEISFNPSPFQRLSRCVMSRVNDWVDWVIARRA